MWSKETERGYRVAIRWVVAGQFTGMPVVFASSALARFSPWWLLGVPFGLWVVWALGRVGAEKQRRIYAEELKRWSPR